MNKKRNRILALFCSLIIMATYFMSPIYQTALAENEDSVVLEEIQLQDEDQKIASPTTEDYYVFKIYAKVGTSISSSTNRQMIITLEDENGDPHTITLNDMFYKNSNTKSFKTNFFPVKATIRANGGGSRTFHWDLYIVNSQGVETQLAHEQCYWVAPPKREYNLSSYAPTISDGYINVYTPALLGKAIVQGKDNGSDVGNLTVAEGLGTNIVPEAYGIDQYGFRYKINEPQFQLIEEGVGIGTNFTTEYILPGDTQYNGEKCYVSTSAKIGTENSIEINSKRFAVNNATKDVTFNANGGIFDDTSPNVGTKLVEQTYAHGYKLPANNPTRAGYTFTGWKDNKGVAINSKSIYNGADSATAQWKEEKYTITLINVKDGLEEKGNWQEWVDKGDGVYTYKSGFGISTENEINLPTAKDVDDGGHVFKGWYEINEEENTGTEVTSIDVKNNLKNINLIAVYSKEALPSILILDKGDAPTALESTIFVKGSGNESITVTKKDCEVFEDLYEGHDFDGLKYTDKDGKSVTVPKSSIDASIELSPQFTHKIINNQDVWVATATAQYKAKTYTVTKNTNDESNNVKSDSLIFGESYDLGTPTRANYEFKGWNTEAKGTGLTIPTTGTVDTSFDGLTVYAQWEPKTVKVTYFYGYDCESNTERMLSPEQPYVFPEEANIEGTTIHWFDESGKEISSYDNVSKDNNGITLKAKYSFPITLDYGYYNKVSQHTVTYGEKYNLPDLEGKRNGWNFVGWYNRTKYIDPEATVKIKPEENTTLVGKWSPTVQVQMQESVTTIVDSFGEVEVDENDIPMYKMSAIGLDKEEVYQAVKLLLVLRHKYPNINVSDFIDESKGWLETLRSKISTKHHESEGLEVKGLEWFIKMTAAVKTENDDLWEEMSSRIDRNQILKLYDVELLDIIKELSYEPSTGAVTLRIPIPENIDDYQDAVLFHYNKVKNEMEYLDYEVKDGFYEVQLTSFSPIGIAANTKFGKAAATGDKIPSLLSAGALLAGLGISIMFKKKKDEDDLHK